jgi:uncharacterized protein (DUF2132 family)
LTAATSASNVAAPTYQEPTLTQANNPLHGITLETIVTRLQQHYGWEGLAERIRINCFSSDPSVKSSLKFLRRTDWARTETEQLYLKTFGQGDCPITVPAGGRKNGNKRPLANNNRPTAANTRATADRQQSSSATPAHPQTAKKNAFIWPDISRHSDTQPDSNADKPATGKPD